MTDDTNPVAELVKNNRAALDRLVQTGFNTEALVMTLSSQVLLEMIYPSGTPMRSTFDAIFESNLADHLKAAESAMTRRKLTEGVAMEKP